MLCQSQSYVLSSPSKSLAFSPSTIFLKKSTSLSFPSFKPPTTVALRSKTMISNSKLSNHIDSSPLNDTHLDCFADVANKLTDAAGDVIRSYFRKKFKILDKEDLSPVTIADQAAEEAMVSIIFDSFPSHAVYGEEKRWRCKEDSAEYVWVLDPIDGTKSFMTGI